MHPKNYLNVNNIGRISSKTIYTLYLTLLLMPQTSNDQTKNPGQETTTKPKEIEVDNALLITIKDNLDYLGKAVPVIMDLHLIKKEDVRIKDWEFIKKMCQYFAYLSKKLFPKPLDESDISKFNPNELTELKKHVTSINNKLTQFHEIEIEPIIYRIEKSVEKIDLALDKSLNPKQGEK